ncbi:MAG TPA: helix-turn-helix domain-containing protein, partial [Spirochaetia bacterium]|nr:helix-turn-helix domain-containing protein [Spirochaetia bacterium]
EHFLDEGSRSLFKKKLAVSAELLPLLATYHFPGNIRELRAMVYDAVGRQTERMLPLTPFRQAIGRSVEEMPIASPDTVLSFGGRLPTIKQATDLLIEEALRRAEGNQSLAAGLLGISHQALNKRVRHNHHRKPDRG